MRLNFIIFILQPSFYDLRAISANLSSAHLRTTRTTHIPLTEMFAIGGKNVDGRRESKIMQHNPHSIKTIQKIYDLLSYYCTIPDGIKSKQAHFQVPNGIPIFLKGGPMDKILFGATIGLLAVGLSNMFLTIHGMAFPAKKK